MLFKIKKLVVATLFVATSSCLLAKVNLTPEQAGSNYYAYPVPGEGIPTLSPSPDGYVPFHMEHYGRHGSRWRINPSEYSNAVEILQKAHDQGKLTQRGEELFEEIKTIAKDSRGRLGELTPLGHRQHRGIARRMTQNFPEIFHNQTILDAKSTEVIRCILSMASAMAELQSIFPEMPIRMDASQTTQNILNFNPKDTIVDRLTAEARSEVNAYRSSLPKPETFFTKLFNDRAFVADSLGDAKTFKAIFDLAVNVQSHDDYASFFDVFSEDEIYNEWLARNADWYIRIGNSPLTNNRNHFNQRVLLRNIIESADTAMLSPAVSANLRYGHETMLSPLAVLMELDNFGYETSDLSTLEENWRAFEIFPMGSNIQMVFYRPGNGLYSEDDVLVKVLLNEKETTLPVQPFIGNYYRWKDLRKYYIDKLDNFYNLNPQAPRYEN